jgi:hypothetical protein
MVKCAKTRIILADHSKIGVTSRVIYAQIPEIDLIITDAAGAGLAEWQCLQKGPADARRLNNNVVRASFATSPPLFGERKASFFGKILARHQPVIFDNQTRLFLTAAYFLIITTELNLLHQSMRYLLPVGASPGKSEANPFLMAPFLLYLFSHHGAVINMESVKPLTDRISNNRPLTLSPVAQDNPCDLREMMTERMLSLPLSSSL